MKRMILAACVATLFAGRAVAIPADPSPKQVRQADGSVRTVYLAGDEYWHALYTADGQSVRWNAETRMLEPVTLNRADFDRAAVRRAAAQRRWSRHTAAKGPRRLRMNQFPTIGKSRSLVFLLEFSDTKFTSVSDPHDFFNRMLNERGFSCELNGAHGSAMDFYEQSSYGLFDHTFDVIGPIQLDHEATWYGKDDPDQDTNAGLMVVEACQKADALVDFSKYDYDNDGYVDNIFFFYAGIGQATHPEANDYIWPHSADLDEDWELTAEHDGKQIRHYACANELRYDAGGAIIPGGIGVFVHEFGHVLGLMDHYDVGYGMLTHNVGIWDTMARGSYNNYMNTPPLFSAFERAELGWLDYELLTMDADTVCVLPALSSPIGQSNGSKAYRWSVPDTDGREFFVLENRQQVGFDEYLPGHGLVAWHIDIDTVAWQKNNINVIHDHQRVDIVCADGSRTDITRDGDPFPGVNGVTRFDFKAWDESPQFGFDDVSEDSTGLVEFLLANTDFTLPAPAAVTATEVRDSSFTFTWSEVPWAGYYEVTVSDAAGQPIAPFDARVYKTVETVSVTGIAHKQRYTVEVVAVRGSHRSPVQTLTVETPNVPFNERKPENVSASDVTDSGFTAHWSAVDDADGYRITLYHNDFGQTLYTMGYDFSDKAAGLPEGWATSSSTYYSVKGYYGVASPSLRFSRQDDFLEISFPESRIARLSFWYRSSVEGNTIRVEQQKEGEWTEIQAIATDTEAHTAQVDVSDADRVRIRLDRQTGYVVIDDVTAHCHRVERTPVEGHDDISVGNVLSHTFIDLPAGQTYSFRVCATRGDERSRLSAECQVGIVHEDVIRLGFCNGEMAETTSLQMNGTGWVDAVLRMPAAVLSAYAGNRIEAIRVALLSGANIDTLQVWVRDDIEAAPLAAGFITSKSSPRVEKGWNEIPLETPYDITAATGELFVGFSFRQRANVKAISMVGQPVYDTSYLRYQGGDWIDISDLGVLSLEAVVRGENIHQHDLGFTAASVNPAPSLSATALQVSLTVQNFGNADLDGFTVSCETAGVNPISQHISLPLRSTSSQTVRFFIDPGVVTDHRNVWTITLAALDNADDENAANNAVEAHYSFLKNVLVEEFTTEQCINCPRVAAFLHQALHASADYSDRVFAVCHHEGYYTDWLTQPWDSKLTWLYNEGSSLYAPAVMINRNPVYDQRNLSGSKTPCFIPGSSQELTTLFDTEMGRTANAVVGLQLTLNDDSTQVTANVSCLRNDHYNSSAPRLTIYLVEDEIRAHEQIGADGVFVHQHVTRATNDTWGVPVVWGADNRFTVEQTFTLDRKWLRENMQVVALLHSYDGEDHLNIAVENSVGARLLSPVSGIARRTADSARAIDSYNLGGQRVGTAHRGFTLIRMSDGTVRKVVR